MVFLNHGLWLGILLAMAVLAACALWRQALCERIAASPWLFAAGWLMLTLLLSRNLGATALAVLIAPVILLASIRVQLLLAAAIAGAVLLFPMLRGGGWVPTEAVVSIAQSVDAERAASLQFRLDHEDRLLEHANAKPLGGWGSWGRNRVYDPVTGRDLSVTDGYWVIVIGSFGWLGYIARFGLLTVPILLLAFRRREEVTPATAGLALVLAVGLIDLIPNATISPITWLIAGALAGYCLRVHAGEPEAQKAEAIPARWQATHPGGPLRPVLEGGVAAASVAPSPSSHQRQPRS